MNTKFNIQLNHYPTCLLYEANETVYEDTQEQIADILNNHPDFEVDEDDFEFDSDEYENDYKKAFVEAYRRHMPEIVLSLGNPELDKPREYRCFHRGDYCYADVELSEDWLDVMLAWIDENEEWFDERIGEEWASRDGFWSFMDTTISGWKENLQNEDERYIGHMLYYMSIVADEEALIEDLDYIPYEEVGVWGYNHLSKEKREELDALENQPGSDMTNQLEIKFED